MPLRRRQPRLSSNVEPRGVSSCLGAPSLSGRRGGYGSGVHIRFEVPADPAYPGRVAAVLSSVRLRKYSYIGAVLAAVGALGLAALHGFDWGSRVSPLFIAMVLGGLLSMLYAPWVRFNARRRSSRYAVEG